MKQYPLQSELLGSLNEAAKIVRYNDAGYSWRKYHKEKPMTKNQAIRQINESVGFNRLNIKNTHWSNVVEYGTDEGWWLNIPFYKFSQGLNLILNNEKQGQFLHVIIPANSIRNPESTFRNKDDTADIFMPIFGQYRLVDTQSGSTRHNFIVYSIKEYTHSVGLVS